MKKTKVFSFLLVLITTIAVISACGKSGIVGKWKLVERDGQPITHSAPVFDIRSDGTGSIIDSDGLNAGEFTWTYSGNKVTLSPKDVHAHPLELTVKGKRMSYGGGNIDSGVFEKQ